MAGLELGVHLGVHEVVQRGDGQAQQVVQVGGEGVESALVAHEAVDVDHQQLPPRGIVGGGGQERDLRGRAGVRRTWLQRSRRQGRRWGVRRREVHWWGWVGWGGDCWM